CLDRVVFGLAGVQVGTSAAMQRQRRDADILGQAGDTQRIALVPAPAGASLERNRYTQRRTSLDHRLQDTRHEILVAQQGRTGGGVAYLLDRAAHVDIDDPGTL